MQLLFGCPFGDEYEVSFDPWSILGESSQSKKGCLEFWGIDMQ